MDQFVINTMDILLIWLKIVVFKSLLDTYQNQKIRYKKELNFLWKLKIFLGISSLLIGYLVFNEIIILDLWGIRLSLYGIILIFINMYFCKNKYGMNWCQSIMFLLVYKNVICISESVIYWAITFFCIAIGRGGENYPHIVVYVLRQIVMFIVLLVLNWQLKKYRKIFREKKYIISTVVVMFLVTFIYVYNFLEQYMKVKGVEFGNSRYESIWRLMGSFWYQNTIPSLTVVVILLIYTIKKIKESIDLQKEKVVIEEKIKYQYNYYEKIKENQCRTKLLYHDLRNHMICIKNIAEDENASKYCMELQKEIDKIDYVYDTKNDIVDIILKEKNDICIDNNINFFADINFEKCNFLKMIDVCSILSNILDNAIEACLNIKDNERKIYIRGTVVKNYFVLKCVNSKTNNIKIDNNKITSSKKDKYFHGIGLKSVESSLSKYNGEFKFKDLDDEFELDIYIPIESGVNFDYEKNCDM